MKLNARLSPVDLRRTIDQFLPFQLDLDGPEGERWLLLEELQSLQLVAEQGVRMHLSGTVVWPILGLAVPVRIKSLSALLRVTRELRPNANLVLRLSVEDVDIAWLPEALDEALREKVNQEIREHRLELAWDFERLLSHTFQLPENLRSTASVSLHVDATELHITESEIALGLTLLSSTRSRPSQAAE